MRDIRAIIEYRKIRAGLALFNSGRQGFEELAKHPDVLDLMLEMRKAQGDDNATIDDLLASLQAAYPTRDEDA